MVWTPSNDQNNQTETIKYPSVDINACRNPNNDSKGPWCYVSQSYKQREYCPIPICSMSDELNRVYISNPENSFKKTKLWDSAVKTTITLVDNGYFNLKVFEIIYNNM